MRSIVRPLAPSLFLIAVLLAAMFVGVFAAAGPAQAQLDESNPATFWRLERERRLGAPKPPVVIQRPTRMTRGVAPRRGYTRAVPANSVEANADPSAKPTEGDAATPASPALSAAVQPGATTAPSEPAKPAAPAGPPFVIAVFGDNVGQMLSLGVSDAYAERNVTVLRRARENSGLVRDDYFDWPKAIHDFFATDRKIDLAVMMIGSNDRQPIREGGQTHEVLSERWSEIYRARALDIAQTFKDKGVPLIWVGMTVMKNERLSADLAQFNEIYREVAQKTGATFIDVWEPFVDERGRFTLSGPDLNGHITRIRTGDGVHFTRAGARTLAHFIEGDVKRYLDRRTAPAVEIASPSTGNTAPGEQPATNLLGPGGEPLPIPTQEAIAPAPAPPAAGPVVPLTASALSPGGELATRQGADVTGAGVLDALPQQTPTGRADDFSWPRR